ncbi:MAG: hypothetical protein JKY65_03305 [Planctomycetes bacterium]|nr:hypothetical protein [Planctomycetota bacterium]
MHILLGALIGLVVSVALTYVASRVIDKPLTWKDLTASAVAGLIGGAVATATLGVGAATTLRTVVAFAAGGATGSSGGQITDNVLHGHPVTQDLVKSTALGTAIGAGTLGLGKLAGPAFKHAAKLVRRAPVAPAAPAAAGHGNLFAGAAAGLDDAIVPVARYVKKALKEDAENKDASSEHGADPEQTEATQPSEPPQAGMLGALNQSLRLPADEPKQQKVESETAQAEAQTRRPRWTRGSRQKSEPPLIVGLPLGR